MKRKILQVFLLILIFLPLQSFATENAPSEKHYKDGKERYNLVLPEGWKYDDTGVDVYFEYVSKEFYASFYVDGFPLEKGEVLTSQDLASKAGNYDYSEDGWEVHNKVIDTLKTEVDGCPAVIVHQRAELKDNVEGKTFLEVTIIDEYYFVKNDHAYMINFSVSENAYEKIKPSFESIVKSFKVGIKPFQIPAEKPEKTPGNE